VRGEGCQLMAEFGLKRSKMVEERDWNHHGMLSVAV
jgi:hypothetical protein